MSKVQHTPTPWVLSTYKWVTGHTQIQLRTADGNALIGVAHNGHSITQDEAVENGRFMELAVNSHEALVAALKECVSLIESNHSWDTSSGNAVGNTRAGLTVTAARFALRLAEGGAE